MLPGIGGLVGKGGLAPDPFTKFYKTAGGIVVPAGYEIARVTVIGTSGTGTLDQGGNVAYGGGGGALSQSVLAVVAGETLNAVFNTASSFVALKRGSAFLVKAASGLYYNGGKASDGVGQIVFSGGSGGYTTYYSQSRANGGGAAGTAGDGVSADNYAGGARGPGMTFVQTDGEVATNAAGALYNQNGASYGGGPGCTGTAGSGIVIIEWGVGQ